MTVFEAGDLHMKDSTVAADSAVEESSMAADSTLEVDSTAVEADFTAAAGSTADTDSEEQLLVIRIADGWW